METQEYLLKIVERGKGDDLERFEAAFSNLTSEQLKQPYGNSGMTKQQILDDLRKQRQEWETAHDLLNKLLKSQEL